MNATIATSVQDRKELSQNLERISEEYACCVHAHELGEQLRGLSEMPVLDADTAVSTWQGEEIDAEVNPYNLVCVSGVTPGDWSELYDGYFSNELLPVPFC